jgi:hypothetical protein
MENSSDLEKSVDSEILTESSLFDANKPLKLYFNRKHALRKSKWISLVSPISIALPIVFVFLLYWFMKSIFGDSVEGLQDICFFSVVFIVISATPLIVLINVLGHRTFKEALKPAIEVDPIGISINCAGRNFKKIPWQYIREVKTFKIYGWSYVRVIPHDPSILSQYECEEETQSGRLLNACMGKRVYSQPCIDIPDEFLPIGAQEVVDSINIRLKNADKML